MNADRNTNASVSAGGATPPSAAMPDLHAGEPAPASAPAQTGWQRFRLVVRVIEVRLRFVAVLVVVGLSFLYWDTIKNHWQKETRPGGRVHSAVRAALGRHAADWLASGAAIASESDTEYYCPMHPQVVRERLDPGGVIPKCPICGMPLSPRKKGETLALPPGITARVQLSPDRIRLAGIETAEIQARPLQFEISAVGFVNYDESRMSEIVTRVAGYIEKLYVDKTWITVQAGDPLAEIYSPELYTAAQELVIATARKGSGDLARSSRERLELLGVSAEEIDAIVRSGKAEHVLVVRSPQSGHVIRKEVKQGSHVDAGQTLFEVADLSGIWIEAEIYEKDIPFIRAGEAIEATVEALPGRRFSGKVALVHPHLEPSTRTNAVRFELENPKHELRPGMFATVTVETRVADLEPLRGAAGAGPAGAVLAVPERAVIDTGKKKIVYVERAPGLYEGVEVELGARAGDFYPVLKGLDAGQHVAASGAFLIDAETRLKTGAASTYLGAAGGGHGSTQHPGVAHPAGISGVAAPGHRSASLPPDALKNIAGLTPQDRQLALEQAACPISGEPLGSMGAPFKTTLNGQPVFLCCAGCESQARKDADKILARLAEQRLHRSATDRR